MVRSRYSFGRRLRALRLARGLSQVELARRVGRHQTAIGPYERDEYEPPREIVERLALELETSPEYLYFGRSAQQTALPIAGRIGRAGLVEVQVDNELVNLHDVQLRGYRVQDDSMLPVFRPRQLVLALEPSARAPEQLLGRDVLAELEDGRILLRRLMPATDATCFDLAAYNAPTLPSVSVRSVRTVVGALWPEAWSEIAKEP